MTQPNTRQYVNQTTAESAFLTRRAVQRMISVRLTGKRSRLTGKKFTMR